MYRLVSRFGKRAASLMNERFIRFGSKRLMRACHGDLRHNLPQWACVCLLCACLRADILSGSVPSRR